MSVSSTHSRPAQRRVNSQQNGNRQDSVPRARRPSINGNDAYLYALRVAYLAYLLQPRAKRRVEKPLPKPILTRGNTSTSMQDLMKDFSLTQNSKSTKYPHEFIKELEKRLQYILIGRERRPEFQNADVKRSFAVFLNQLSDPAFKRQREQERRAEDLVLIFYSNAIREMQKGRPPGDEQVKRIVDRHVALFVRLLSLILKDKDWAREKPELASRLNTLESKLMKHEEDLSAPTSTETTTIEEEIPLSYQVKDMPLVQAVGRVFGLRQSMLQSDIDKNKDVWTPGAALQDLKTYQTHLNVGTHQTLSSNDFDTHTAFEEWKKAEAPMLSQMMVAIIASNPELAKATSGGATSDVSAQRNGVHGDPYTEMSRTLSQEGNGSSFLLDLPANLGALDLGGMTAPEDKMESIYTFIPPDSRAMFRYILSQALSHDLNDENNGTETGGIGGLLSKSSTELMNEVALRWRIPMFSRMVLFLDIVKDQFVNNELSLDMLDAAFIYVKQPVAEDTKHKRSSLLNMTSALQDRHRWTIADFSLMQQVLSAIYESLLRSLYEALMTCYDSKPSSILGSILTVLDDHIQNDPSFSQPKEVFDQFKVLVAEGLRDRAREVYGEAVEKEVPSEQNAWQFYHIIQLKKSVMKHCDRIQKRYRKNPEILDIKPSILFLEVVLPAFASDSEAIVKSVMADSSIAGGEVPVQDGFDLYKELRELRQIHKQALPNVIFPYNVEELLQDFVWKWIKSTDSQIVGWVENAVRSDKFTVRSNDPSRAALEEERHSVSVIDVFSSFNQIIEQIAELNWDDELTYAKFMTSLSKAISAGVNRYCDLLEQMFTKEMDRMTPEQEAAAKATRQERWMQYAKDTWNQKERIEPFNFYAESFVKLNDISFAIQQWDKLESDVDVDGRAEVIKQHTPPAIQRQKRFTNYVFTIKIVEAEDLKACDVNGYSDPYVVLTDEYQKRLFKSKIVYRNLNPRFDESIDITTQGALNIISTIWDWDAVGDHDYVGRTSLKLDPAHFGDFLPREYWLDLDTQGRVLVRVSMEGERDDIQFHFAKAFRALQRTQRDMTRKITDKLSAYINHCLSRRALRALHSRGITNISNISMSTFSSWRNRASVVPTTAGPTEADILNALKPLFAYFDDNFAIMNQTLTQDAMMAVMTRLWKEILVTIEGLLVPPLSDKPSQQKPLSQPELDVVYKWLQALFDFFQAVDEDTGETNGIPVNILKSPKYHEIQTINFFYTESTENLIRESERMVSATTTSLQSQRSRLSAPASYGHSSIPAGPGGLLAAGSALPNRRVKSIMISRNLGTMRRAKEEKWKAAQAEPSDDMILRILRMRPEAGSYLRDRSRQKERLAAAAAAEMIVRQSLASGGGRMTGPSVMRRDR